VKPPAALVLLFALACASAPAPAPARTPPPAVEEDVGEEGGVEGGVAGGIIGTANPGTARFVPPSVGHAQRLVDASDPRHKPKVRPEHYRGGSLYWALFKLCVSDAGEVTQVETLKSTGVPEVDSDWSATIKSWPHRPYQVDGKPVPFCYPMRLEVRMAKKPPA
jgi:protein TonB